MFALLSCSYINIFTLFEMNKKYFTFTIRYFPIEYQHQSQISNLIIFIHCHRQGRRNTLKLGEAQRNLFSIL